MKNRKIRILRVYSGIVILIAVVVILAAVRLGRMGDGLRSMQDITEEYIDAQQAVHSMREASNFLTEQSREFVISGEKAHLKAYLDEINDTQRRDLALKVLEEYQSDSNSLKELQAAVDSSNELAETEMYAMYLAAEASGMSEEEIRECFGERELSADEAALSAEEKRSTAIELLFDDTYTRTKEEIQEESYKSLENLIENTRARQIESYEDAISRLKQTRWMFMLILGASLFSLIITAVFVVVPLRRSVRYIHASEKLPLKGAAEYIYLAETYNHMLETTQKHQEQLSFEATHDELTGVFNRKVFEELRGELFETGIAMLLVDVDYFKEVNDTYGHEKGDAVLKKIAEILVNSFRADDYVCRIGGDEFAVIMRHMTPGLKGIVLSKVDNVRALLAAAIDIPPVTLSIGAAFSGGEIDEDVYRRADEALYEVKEKGRNGFAFYDGKGE